MKISYEYKYPKANQVEILQFLIGPSTFTVVLLQQTAQMTRTPQVLQSLWFRGSECGRNS
jgi:hypothetical protein